MRTVLVSGASGIVGYGILRSLRRGPEPLRLVATTIHLDSAAQAFSDVFEHAPRTSSDGYLPWLLGVIRRHHVDLLVPSIEADLYAWNEHRAEIEATGAALALNDPGLIRRCQDKWTFYQDLVRQAPDLAIPTRLEGSWEELAGAFGVPFLLKPRRGFASKGIVRVASEAEFQAQRAGLGAVLMAQPIVGSADDEYTVSAFFDEESACCCHLALRRRLSPEGFTQSAEVCDLEGAEEAIGALGRAWRARGPTNFQFRVHQGALKLLEINPRISSATSIRAAFGYNESLMSVAHYLDGRRPERPSIRKGRAVRYTEEIIIYDGADR